MTPPGSALPTTTPQPTQQQNGTLKVSIRIPTPSASANALRRRPNYISPNTQSIGVVVTNQGFSPSPAVYTNVSTCPLVSGIVTCTVVVQAIAGNDTFTITTYSGANGGGSVLSTGSITATIPASGPLPAVALALGGVVGSVTETTTNANLPLSQTMSVAVSAKDASGATIVGTYDNPIMLSGPGLAVSPTNLPDSTTASNVTVSWPQSSTATTAATLTATVDGETGTLNVTPASGFAFYTTGANQATDVYGFKMLLGPDGNLYYTTIGSFIAGSTANNYVATAGSVHQFNPTTFADKEVALQGEGVGLAFDANNDLWIAGGANPTPSASPYVYQMAAGSFAASSLTAIAVPGTSLGAGSPAIRALAQDNAGHMWFVDASGGRLLYIANSSPLTSTSIVAESLPSPPAGTLPYGAEARTLNFANGVLVAGSDLGFVYTALGSNGSVEGQFLTNLQTTLGENTTASLYDSATDGTTVYVTQTGDDLSAYFNGDIEAFTSSSTGTVGTFNTVPVVAGPVSAEPATLSVNGGLLYYGDFSNNALGVTNVGNGASRSFPMILPGGSTFSSPDGIAAMSDGTAWFVCSGSVGVAASYPPICVGHTVYTSTWGLWPGSSISLYGAGAASAQLVGIMEAPSSNSGPFTVASSNTNICTASTPLVTTDHDFVITGVSAGACTVTVTDASNHAQTIDVVVTTTTGTVNARRRARMVHL